MKTMTVFATVLHGHVGIQLSTKDIVITLSEIGSQCWFAEIFRADIFAWDRLPTSRYMKILIG